MIVNFSGFVPSSVTRGFKQKSAQYLSKNAQFGAQSKNTKKRWKNYWFEQIWRFTKIKFWIFKNYFANNLNFLNYFAIFLNFLNYFAKKNEILSLMSYNFDQFTWIWAWKATKSDKIWTFQKSPNLKPNQLGSSKILKRACQLDLEPNWL